MTRSLSARKLTTTSLLLIVFVFLFPSSTPTAMQSKRSSRVISPVTLPKPSPHPTPVMPVETAKPKKIPVPNNKYTDYCSPPFFFCPDAGEIFITLLENNVSFSKGKFEKTAEWEFRQQHLLDDIHLNDELTMGSEMTFLYVQGTDAPESNEPVYDADREQWTFGLHFHAGPDSTTCLPMVSRKNNSLFCLVVPFDMSSVTAALVDMPIADAEKNDGALQIALVGNVIPKDVYSHGFKVWGFFFDLKEMICLNPKTGENWKVRFVLAKPEPVATPQ